jgi:type I restriction enzyme R subunit
LGAKKEKDSIDIKIELMKNILMDEVKLRLHKKKHTPLKDELERVIENYHKNAIDLYTTIAELIERAKLLKKKTTATKN